VPGWPPVFVGKWAFVIKNDNNAIKKIIFFIECIDLIKVLNQKYMIGCLSHKLPV
jgi:hypothetical protein